MSVLIDTSGEGLDWKFRKGEQRTFVVLLYSDAEMTVPVTTIASARVAFFTGTIESPVVVHSDISITPTVTSGTTITFTVTSTHTRTLTVGRDYCWALETTYLDGTIETQFAGDILALTEIP